VKELFFSPCACEIFSVFNKNSPILFPASFSFCWSVCALFSPSNLTSSLLPWDIRKPITISSFNSSPKLLYNTIFKILSCHPFTLFFLFIVIFSCCECSLTNFPYLFQYLCATLKKFRNLFLNNNKKEQVINVMPQHKLLNSLLHPLFSSFPYSSYIFPQSLFVEPLINICFYSNSFFSNVFPKASSTNLNIPSAIAIFEFFLLADKAMWLWNTSSSVTEKYLISSPARFNTLSFNYLFPTSDPSMLT